MSTFVRLTAMALLAALAAAIQPTPAMAQLGYCEKGDRIWHSDADCLKASWRNKKWPKRNRYDAQNLCSEYGTVVAKVDIEHHVDTTWYLTNGSKKGAGVHNDYDVKGIYCCPDLGDTLCNLSDITTERCKALFAESSASETCRYGVGSGGTTEIKLKGKKCEVTRHCNNGRYYQWTSITVKFGDTNDLHNCGGNLQVGAC